MKKKKKNGRVVATTTVEDSQTQEWIHVKNVTIYTLWVEEFEMVSLTVGATWWHNLQ